MTVSAAMIEQCKRALRDAESEIIDLTEQVNGREVLRRDVNPRLARVIAARKMLDGAQ